MPGRPVKIISCSVLNPEIAALEARGLINAPVRFLDLNLHMDPLTFRARLEEIIQEERDTGYRTVLFYGDCSSCIPDLERCDDVTRVPGNNCGEILLGEARYREFIAQGAFFLFPGWSERWEEIITRFPGMDVENSRSMMGDMHNRLIYLDTGIRPVPRDALRACADHFGLPCDIVDVGIDGLRDAIQQMLDGAAAASPDTPGTPHVRAATAVMMLDIMAAVLAHPDRIPETASRLSRKIRELTGSHIVVLAVTDETGECPGGYRILSVQPARHASLAESAAIVDMITKSFRMDRARVMPYDGPGTPPGGIDLLPCLVIPLRRGGKVMGSILSFGLTNADFTESILEIQDVLSNIVAVVLKNALLAERERRARHELELEIVEHRKARETLIESEDRFRALSDATWEGLLIHRDGMVIDVNRSLSEMFGHDQSEAVGMYAFDLLTPGTRAKVSGEFKSIDAAVDPLYFQGEAIKKDGTVFPIECLGRPIIFRGRPARLNAIRDLTAQKMAERELREKERFTRSILETTQEGFGAFTSEGKITIVNDALCMMLGYERGELLHMRATHFIAEENPDITAERLASVLSGRAETYESRHRRKDGSIFPTEVFLNYTAIEGGHFFCFIRDITERKRMEESLRSQLEEKEILLRETHHRIKNNISAIAGLLMLHARSTNSPEAAAVLNEAIGRVDSMAMLYHKMLAASEYRALPVGDYLGDITESIIALFPERAKISLRKSFDMFSLGSKTLFPLAIIVNELLTNIMKYAFAGMDTGEVYISAVKSGDRVTLTIHDNGRGLPEGFDIETSKGFGLILVKLMVRQIAGSIKMESGAGTTCSIEFTS